MNKNNSLSNLSLKRRMWIAISLITVLPLIIFFYYVYGYDISFWATAILGTIVFLGWWIVFEVFSSIVGMCTRSRIALGRIGEEVPSASDEVQNLESIINLLSDKVKDSFSQLKDFTRMTGELNKEVSKKVLILSTVLQANDLFSKETPAEEVIKFLANHLKELMENKVCFCSLKESLLEGLRVVACEGISSAKVKEFGEGKDSEIPRIGKIIVVDNYSKPAKYLSWAKELGLNNLAISPIISRGQIVGIVGIGNKKDNFSFGKDDLDVLNLFSQNVTLIWEHQRLSSKIEELEVLDHLTGLYNEKMISKRLDEEIKRATAYQRPCGFISVKVVNYKDFQKKSGQIEAERNLKIIAKNLKKCLRPIDMGGRISPDALGAILIEKNKRQSQEIASSLDSLLKKGCSEEIELLFSVAESPIDGISATELLSFVRKQKKNK